VEKKLILRGILVGAVAGLLAFVFARIFAEPFINAAIKYESGRDAAQAVLDKAAGIAAPPDGPDLFSRTIQANVGIGVGMVGFGAAMGAFFSVVFIACVGRVGRMRPRSLALAVAAAGFLAIYLVPFIKYPANPPSIGNPDTIKQRGAYYLVMVFAAVVLLGSAVWLGKRLRARLGNWNASLVAGGAFVVVVGVVMALLPKFGHLSANVSVRGVHTSETPLPLRDANGTLVYPGFPADVLFNFRLYSIGAQLILWTVLGVGFGAMAERIIEPGARAARHPDRESVAV
jgi:hypothetical protein